MSKRSMHRITLQFPLLVLTLIAFSVAASAQRGSIFDSDSGDSGTGGNYIIQGTIYFPSGQQIDKRIRVRLFTLTRGDITTMTDDNGRFVFRRLSPGNYEVVVDGEKEYQAARQQVSIFQTTRNPLGAEQIIPVQIRLQFKTSDEFKAGVLNSELAGVPEKAVKFYDQAIQLAKSGNNKAAVEQLQKALAEYPKFAVALTELGVQYQRLDQLDKAEESLKSALQITPNAFTALVNYGIVLVRLKRFAEAETELRLALKQKDQSAVAHFYLGRALAYSGKFDEAKKELSVAINLGGEEMKEAHRYLAGVYNAVGDREHAIAELETYLKLAPKSEDAAQIRELIRKLRG